jgi:nitric oxide reductase large subunit
VLAAGSSPLWLGVNVLFLALLLVVVGSLCVLSLLPVGLMQTWASVDHGYWYARSSEFMQTPLMQNLRWMRVPGVA